MSSDVDQFYVQRSEPLEPLLPTDVDWEDEGEECVTAAQPGLGFQVWVRIEPIDPGDDAWRLLDRVLDAIGGPLGGATFDIRTGHALVWRDGRRERA